jgi:Asp-tRNA(Asn)/Glu-tRNA(Gln) amidotransferase A subunit family amidase
MIVILAGVDSQGPPFGLHTPARRWDDERLLDIAESLVGAKR